MDHATSELLRRLTQFDPSIFVQTAQLGTDTASNTPYEEDTFTGAGRSGSRIGVSYLGNF
jgi:hypothetical protein